MGRSSLLLFTLSVSLLSLGCNSNSLGNQDHIRVTLSEEKDVEDILEGEFIPVLEVRSDSVEGSGQTGDGLALNLIDRLLKQPECAGSERRSGSGLAPALVPKVSGAPDPGANSSITGYAHSSWNVISEEPLLEGKHFTTGEQLGERQINIINGDLDGWDGPKFPVQTNMFTPVTKQDLSGPGVSCVLGPCVVFTSVNGTNLLWDDMRRTLAFAWELHVYGSAGLFILIAALAVVGTAGACRSPRPFSDALVLANALLILSGTLRGLLLLLDPYGTRQILSRAILAALHNVPLQLLLWAQVSLALVTLKGLRLMLFPLKLQPPWVVAVLSTSICSSLLLADIFSPTLSPATPLLLQTLSLCWGLPFCIVILIKSFSNLQPISRTPATQWVTPLRIQKRAKRVTAVCAFLGLLCCSLHMYSLLWLYGLLGNWRRFGWGWWLSQFWARVLEVSWGFSLLVLGSWIFWTPPMLQSRGGRRQSRIEASKMVDETSLWASILSRLQKGPLIKTEKTWEDLMPSNWAKYNLSRTGFCNTVMCPYDDTPSIIPEYKVEPVCSSSCSDPQAALLWQKVSERDCVLSLIEFDIRPPSPINLRRSIDNALRHGGLISAQSWNLSGGAETPSGEFGNTTFPAGRVGYRWRLDTDSPSEDHSRAKEPVQTATAVSEGNRVWSQASAHRGENFHPAAFYPQDWSDEDVTDL